MDSSRGAKVLTCTLSIALLFTATSTVAAQERDTAVERDRIRFTEAVELADQERWEEALPISEELQVSRPHPVILYNIAWCRSRLGLLDEALEAFEDYLDLGDTSDERLTSAREERDRLTAAIEPGERDAIDHGDEREGARRFGESLTEREGEVEPEEWERPSRRRLSSGWFWSFLGLSLATGAAAIVTGAMTWEMRRQWLEEGNADSRATGLVLRTTTDILLLTLVAEALTTLLVGLFTSFDRGSPDDLPEGSNRGGMRSAHEELDSSSAVSTSNNLFPTVSW